MSETSQRLDAEEAKIRQRMTELRAELNDLQRQLETLAQERQRLPRLRGLAAHFQAASPAPVAAEAVPTEVVPLPPAAEPEPMDLLRRSAAGTAVFALPTDKLSGLTLLIRGQTETLARLGPLPGVKAAVVPILVCVGPEEAGNVYEAWANECPGGARPLLQNLATQPRLTLYLHGDSCRLERSIDTANPLQAFAKKALVTVAGEWPMAVDDFLLARRAVYKRHGTAWALWHALKA
jgi:hypothetical protein